MSEDTLSFRDAWWERKLNNAKGPKERATVLQAFVGAVIATNVPREDRDQAYAVLGDALEQVVVKLPGGAGWRA